MLWTLVLILLILWLLGLVTAHTFGGLIYILLVVALIVVVVRLLQGRTPQA
ncbi:MAG: lmo0937 family membrane protein [Tepidisphaeraceae bacterium]